MLYVCFFEVKNADVCIRRYSLKLFIKWVVDKLYLQNNVLFSYFLRRIIEAKLNVEPELLRGATFEERFFDDTILLRWSNLKPNFFIYTIK